VPPEKLIHLWVLKYFEKHKNFPTKNSGIVEFADAEYKGITWAAIDARFKRKRNSVAFSSLSKFIKTYSPPMPVKAG